MNATTKFLLTAGALAVTALVSTAHAQFGFRSATSAFVSGGGGTPVAPTLRSSTSAIITPGPNRLYSISAFPTNVDPAVDPPTERGNWVEGTGTYKALSLSRAKFRGSNFKSVVRSSATSPGRVMQMKLISDPIPTSQTIAGTLNWVVPVGESSTSQNAFTKLHVYVLRAPDTLVGTLLGNYEEASTSGNEWASPSCGAGKGPAGGTAKALTSVAAQAGDRIVIEFGWVGYSTRLDTGYYCTGGGLDDMAVGGVTNKAPWFEFSQDIYGSTISKPSGTVAGDVMIASIAVRPTTATITPPAGWTPVGVRTNSSDGTNSLAIYRRTADASDSSVTHYVWSTSGATVATGTIQSFSGVDTANPIDVQNGQATPSDYLHATPDVTTTVANTLLVTTHAMATGNDHWTAPSGMTEIVDVAVGSATGGIFVGNFTVVQTTAAATGAKTASKSVSFTPYTGNTHILALRGIGGGGSNTLTINKPAGVVQNDVMIASISVGPSTATITPPAGWTLVRRTDNSSGTSNSLAVYSKLAGASEPASYDWTLGSGHTGAAGGIMAFLGADPAFEAENGQNTASGTSHLTPSVNTALYNTMIITSHSVGAASNAWTPPAGMTEAVDAAGGSAGLEMNYVLQAAAVPPPAPGISKTATSSATGTGNAHIIALRRVLGSFNAFETTTATGAYSGFIKTKVAGTTVNLATVSLNAAKGAVATTYVGTVRVELLDASDNLGVLDPATGCRSSWTVIQTLSPDITFVPADLGRKNISFSVPNSYRDVRLRMSAPVGAPDTIGCSSDNFAMRPHQFVNVQVTDNDWETAGTTRQLSTTSETGTPIHKAGRPFTVRATAVNSSSATTTNYTGTPTATLSDCGSNLGCVATFGTLELGAPFAAGQLTSNVATYSDVGAFRLELVDSSFATVDAADGSTATEREIKSNSTIDVGRFVPDHFAVAFNGPIFGTGCGSGSFTYVGQPLNYTVAPIITVTAQNFANGTTANYTGDLWRITSSSLTGKAYTAATGTLSTSGLPGTDPAIADSGGGTGTLTFGSGLRFNRSTAVAPFDAEISLAINVIDADGVAYTANPARFGQASAGNGIAFDAGKATRFGRLALKNANGSQLVPLRVQVEAQYAVTAGAGTVFVTNKDDNCTTLANNNIQMSGFTANLAACETAVSGAGALAGGRGTLILLPPGNANNGSVLLTANLGATSGTTCTTVGGGTVSAAGANRTYLQGAWSGSVYDDDPSARAAFGTKRGAEEVIFIRENF